MSQKALTANLRKQKARDSQYKTKVNHSPNTADNSTNNKEKNVYILMVAKVFQRHSERRNTGQKECMREANNRVSKSESVRCTTERITRRKKNPGETRGCS